MKFIVASLLMFVLILFTSCDEIGKDDCPVVDYVNSFLAENEEIVFYGNAGISEIVDKTGIYGIEGIGEVAKEQMSEIKEGLVLEERLYFALGGPLGRDGSPSTTYLFMHVRDQEKLEDYLSANGFLFEEEDGLKISEDVGAALGMTDDLIIMVDAGFNGDSKGLMKKAFEAANKKDVNDQIAETLKQSGDINLTTHFQNLYSTSNTDLTKLPEEKQKKIQEMAAGSFATTSLRFLPGKLEIESVLDLNEKMEEFFVFNESQSTDIISKIGPGIAKAGFTLDLNIEKIDALLDEYLPEAKEEVYAQLELGGDILKATGVKNLSQILDGTIGIALLGDENGINMDSPKVHLFAGVNESSSMIADFLTDLLEEGEIEKVGKGVYRSKDAVAKLIGDELILKANYNDEEVSLNPEKAEIPGKISNFGKQPMTMFIDVEAITKQSLGIDPMVEEVVGLVDYITLEAGNHGGKFEIIMHDKSSNILEGILMNFRGQIEGMAQDGLAI